MRLFLLNIAKFFITDIDYRQAKIRLLRYELQRAEDNNTFMRNKEILYKKDSKKRILKA